MCVCVCVFFVFCFFVFCFLFFFFWGGGGGVVYLFFASREVCSTDIDISLAYFIITCSAVLRSAF